jgi:hypothetical protein
VKIEDATVTFTPAELFTVRTVVRHLVEKPYLRAVAGRIYDLDALESALAKLSAVMPIKFDAESLPRLGGLGAEDLLRELGRRERVG